MARLLKAQLEGQEKRMLDAISYIIRQNISALRGEIVQERNDQTADVQRIEARMRSEATAAFLHRFVPSLPQKRPTMALANANVFSFRQHARGNNGSEKLT